MTRIVCIGDTHFGPGDRNQDKYAALDQIIVWALAQPNLGAWLHAGDLNHGKMTIEDRNALAPRFQKMADAAPVFVVRGNHDHDGDLLIFSKLKAKYPITVLETPGVHRIALATGGHAAIFGVPYVHRGGLVTAGVQHEDLGQAARALLDPLFITAAEMLTFAQQGGDLPIFLAHLAIGGAVMSTGQPSIGREIEIDPALLFRLGVIPKLLGHIHKHQEIHGAWYLGSTTKTDFGENEDKVFGVLDFETPFDWWLSFQKLDVPEQLLIEGRLTREGFRFEHDECMCKACGGAGQVVVGEHYVTADMASDAGEPAMEGMSAGTEWGQCDVCNGTGRRSWTGADIRCRYHYRKSETSALDTAHIMAEFAGCRSLKLDPIAELEHTVRVPEVAAAVTLNAKAEAYCAHRQIAWTSSIAAKLDALQQQPAEVVLAAVREMAMPARTSELVGAPS